MRVNGGMTENSHALSIFNILLTAPNIYGKNKKIFPFDYIVRNFPNEHYEFSSEIYNWPFD